MAMMAEGPTPVATASGTLVKKEALPKLLDLLSPVAHLWDLFAQQIGVPPAQISQIKVANPQSGPDYLYKCLTQALEWWVANDGDPVYERMSDVLDPGIGKTTPVMNRALARELREFMGTQRAAIFSTAAVSPGLHDPTAVKGRFTQTNEAVIRAKFACLLEFVEMKLQQKLGAEKIERKLQLFVVRLFNVPDSSIPVSSDVSVIFEAMRSLKLLTYLNIAGLEQIIKHYCEGDSEAESKMVQYKRDLSGFELATKIKDFNYITKAQSKFPRWCESAELPLKQTPAYLKELAVKLEHRVAEYHLDYLRELWQLLSDVLSLPPLSLILDAVIMNSVLVVWLIPTAVVPEAIEKAKQNTDFFKEHPILKVTIGDACVYSKAEPTDTTASDPKVGSMKAVTFSSDQDTTASDPKVGSMKAVTFSSDQDGPASDGSKGTSASLPSSQQEETAAHSSTQSEQGKDEPAGDGSMATASDSLPSHQQEEPAIHSSTQPQQARAEPFASGCVDAQARSHPPPPPVEEAKSTSNQSECEVKGQTVANVEGKVVFNPTTTHYSSYFALKATMWLDDKQDKTFNYDSVDFPVWFDICEMLRWYGAHQVGKRWAIPEILMELQFDSDKAMKKFLQGKRKIETAMKEIMMKRLHTIYQGSKATFEVSTLLLLATPDTTNRKMEFRQVTLANYRTCASLYVESKAAELPSQPEILTTVPEDLLTKWDLPELMVCLADVVDWFSLGLFLRIPHPQLQRIESDCPPASGRSWRLLSDVLAEWIQNHQEEAKWSNLVGALSAIGMRAVARKVAQEYGVCVPDSDTVLEDLSPEQSDRLQQVLAEVKELLKNIKPTDQQLAQIEHSIEEAQSRKQLTLKAFDSIVKGAVSKLTALTTEKENLERKILAKNKQLIKKSGQLDRLRQSREQESRQRSEEIRELERTASALRDDVSRLKEQLVATDHQLNIERVKHENDILKKLTEISTIANQANQLEHDKRMLNAELNRERTVVRTLESLYSQAEVSNTALNQISGNLMNELSTAGQRQLQMMSEMAQQAERHRQEIAVRDGMIAAALLGDQQRLLQQQQATQLNPEAVGRLEELASVIAKHEGKGQAIGQQRITIRGIRWRTARDTPVGMWRGAAVSHGNVAYFNINSRGSTAVYCYESQRQLWRQLPDCPSRDSALVMADNKLTTIGGQDQHLRPTNSLASLTGEGKRSKWVELFPRMPTARSSLAAVCRGRNVIAAGGYGDGDRVVTTVEILDTELRQWSSAASLPHPMSWASITVCEDLLYLLGGYDQNGRTLSVLTSSITDLLHQQQETANQTAVWRQAADAPYYGSTAVSVGGQLLAIGGRDEHGKSTSAVVAYDPTSDSWQDMGHMATPRWRPLVAVLRNQLIVAGGFGGDTKVEIGNVV